MPGQTKTEIAQKLYRKSLTKTEITKFNRKSITITVDLTERDKGGDEDEGDEVDGEGRVGEEDPTKLRHHTNSLWMHSIKANRKKFNYRRRKNYGN